MSSSARRCVARSTCAGCPGEPCAAIGTHRRLRQIRRSDQSSVNAVTSGEWAIAHAGFAAKQASFFWGPDGVRIWFYRYDLGCVAGGADCQGAVWRGSQRCLADTGGLMPKVRVSKCGGICGVVIWLKDPINPATGKPQVDDKNPNPALAKRPMIGLPLSAARARPVRTNGRGRSTTPTTATAMPATFRWRARMRSKAASARCASARPGRGRRADSESERHSGARVSANPESRDSPMCNCTSEVRRFASPRNDHQKISQGRIPTMGNEQLQAGVAFSAVAAEA
jgi:hypothetical protein